MTKVTFYGSEKKLSGFKIVGHCTDSADDLDGKLLCAAVSSAAYMAANTITEIAHAKCEILERDGYLSLKLTDENAAANTVLSGFLLHMKELAKQYGNNILVNLEV